MRPASLRSFSHRGLLSIRARLADHTQARRGALTGPMLDDTPTTT
jgi:hypothetical protein